MKPGDTLTALRLFPMETRLLILRRARALAVKLHGPKPGKLRLRFYRLQFILAALKQKEHRDACR
jgi:hypothetical protein